MHGVHWRKFEEITNNFRGQNWEWLRFKVMTGYASKVQVISVLKTSTTCRPSPSFFNNNFSFHWCKYDRLCSPDLQYSKILQSSCLCLAGQIVLDFSKMTKNAVYRTDPFYRQPRHKQTLKSAPQQRTLFHCCIIGPDTCVWR
jgi:hypothetical protein